MGADSMPATAIDLNRTIPSIVPSDIPAMSDDECLLRLDRTTEAAQVKPQLDLALAAADIEITSSCFCRLHHSAL